ncbi:immunity 26/phosphotriesterase HocA family protein [Snodgrassella alvi]|uniref:immunity 26/phosphotriesterase HocA family protein n=1 Tax=Snodgrassella alvi TaxID=1196083 RepID=UPI000C1EEC1A|nr:immunity 26/phosphotriesterase HocA family protein [Snodgrassella alvi]PIT13724.1 phosphotriesterase [Snodgrassella alvi]PIT16285.1 phosphotriesterase [Snodgrassella alvi]PIT19499.1 phosphotriesterase [Snodgrassella alvi]
MSDFKLWGWDKKPRTMLRFIKAGDIFCFKLDEQRYCFGRIIIKFMVGHIAELFDNISNSPDISEAEIKQARRLIESVILDSYSLFDRKIEKGSDWRIIGHQQNYLPTDMDGVYFIYGVEQWCKKVDIWGNEIPISEQEAESLPRVSPFGDYNIKELLKDI